MKNAIVQQAVIDWTYYTKRVRQFEDKYPYCTNCDGDEKCFFFKSKTFGRKSLMMEYRLAVSMVQEVERFLESDFCEWVSGIDKGYILNRLKREPIRVRQKGTNT